MAAIEARSIDREKSAHVNQFSLRFRESEKERLYHQDFDLGFTCSILCSFFLLILSAALQVRKKINFLQRVERFQIQSFFFIGCSFTSHPHPLITISHGIRMD